MGRVETRLYKRRQARNKRILQLFVLVCLAAVVALILGRINGDLMTIQGLQNASEDNDLPGNAVESREVSMIAETWYAIQTGVFSTEEAARQKAEDYTARGAPGTVVSEGGKWRVFIACYGTEADAMAVKRRLEEKQRVDTYLYTWQCPEVRLRLTGKISQIDAVEAGLTQLTATTLALRDAAIDLDAGELTTEEASAVAQAMKDAITLWERTVSERFGRNKPSLVEEMLQLMNGWKQRFETLMAQESPTQLSADLKGQAMEMYAEMIAWRNRLLQE